MIIYLFGYFGEGTFLVVGDPYKSKSTSIFRLEADEMHIAYRAYLNLGAN